VITDLVLVGGGLANSLIAYRLLATRPELSLVVLERQHTLGADHTWSFHDSDLNAEQRRWVAPLVSRSWSRHELRFPNRRRFIEGGYHSVTSDRLHATVAAALGDRLRPDAEVADIRSDRVTLSDGRSIAARAVIDGRGDPGGPHLDVAFQKFFGLFLRLAVPHDLDGPILMDATVDQRDGYRFVYTLPFSPTQLLVEDTYYSDDPALDDDGLRRGILAYAEARPWEIAEVTGSERGVLPITLGGDIEALWNDGAPGVARSGMRGAFFHPTTGYSLPEAVRLADRIATAPEIDGSAIFELTRTRSRRLWAETSYFRLLNRMLFRAAEPKMRYRVFERFYGLSDGLIRRFYAGRLKWTDKARLLIGRPPVPIHRAIHCLVERRGTADVRTRRSGGTS
jgi:lycopene beta-cyclase